jgi:probable F420-dependent oxidoreductase
MLEAGPIADITAAAEDAGWAGFALTEHPVPSVKWLEGGGHQALDPFVALGHAAARTSRLKLITKLSVSPYRNPFLLAKAAMTVDRLSAGRFILGVGTGYLRSEFRALGVEFEERNALFDETLDVLALHWSGEPFSYEGTHFTARDVIGLPRPTQTPIPIWIGGNSRLSRQRVAEKAQGWMPILGSAEMATTSRTAAITNTEELGSRIAELHSLAGERADHLDIAVGYYDQSIVASPNRDVARHRDRLEELEKLGATWISVAGNQTSSHDTLEFLASFGATYIR